MGIQYSFRRYEKKYFLSPRQQEQLLQRIAPYMKEDAFDSYTICNIYYDTPDWRLIRASLEKPAYKEKLRVRSYGVPTETDRVFVELKKKFDGVVYKRRITTEVPQVEPLLCGSTEAKCQIGREIQWFQRQNRTRPRVFIGYDRLAFAGQEDPQLRLTFDTNLRWRDTQLDLCMGDWGAPILQGEDILMELKLPEACPLWLTHALTEVGAFPTSFSKYGTCYKEHIFRNQRRRFSVLDSILTSGLTLPTFLICTAASLILGLVTALVCMYRQRCSRGFAVTLAILPGDGADGHPAGQRQHRRRCGGGGSLQSGAVPLRSRHGPGDRRAIFLAMAIGLATGMGYVALAAHLLRHRGGGAAGADGHELRRAQSRRERLLKITIPENLDYDGLFDDIFRQYTSQPHAGAGENHQHGDPL